MTENVLIEASAGTGKTQALAERLIALVKGGLEPYEIVALTFSRAAAGEIFERFVSMLADRAQGDPSCAALLRKVVATQHLSQIGTLDSFLMRIARSFPLELGLDGGVEIMDDYRSGQELARISFSVLRRTDASARRAFTDAFSLAMNGEDVRSFIDSYRKFVRDWQKLFRANPSERAWGDASAIFGETPAWVKTDEKALSLLADRLAGICDSAAWPEFVEWVRNFRGDFNGIKGFAKKFFELDDILTGATIEVKYNRKTYSFGGAQAQAVREAMLGVCGYVVGRCLGFARGVYRLISEYEKDYDANVRGKGKLVFDDVPRLLASLPADVRLALEYRLDAKIRAWALDEFQDTSRDQWAALSPLVDEAKMSDGEKSVFVVGDRKQAIYGWRNGDVGIFRGERDGGAYAIEALNKTYRSSHAVVEAVNRVFVRGRLRGELPGWEDYFRLVGLGMINAKYYEELYAQPEDTVLISLTSAYLSMNRHADYQIWLNVGAPRWWERFYGELTNDAVLSRHWIPDKKWDVLTASAYNDSHMTRQICGLLCRCRKQVKAYASELNEAGMEQRSRLLMLFASMTRRFKFDKPTEPVPDIEFIPELREEEAFYPGVSDQPPIGQVLRESGAVTGFDPEGGE